MAARLNTAVGLVGVMASVAWQVTMAAELPPMDCVVEPSEVIDLSSAVNGVVETVLVDRGDLVQAGQIVARLDSGVEQAALEYARARAASNSQLRAEELTANFAERRKDRLASLYNQKVLSQDQMDESATSAQLKRLQLQQARENQRLAALDARQADEILKRHVIRSPVSGVVVQRFLAPGESVEDKPIMRIAQINPLRAEAIIPVAFFGSVQAGQRAVVVPEAPKNGQYPGVVTVVDRVADAASGTFRARVSLPNANHDLPSGLRCTVKFLQAGESLSQGDLPAPPAARPSGRNTALSKIAPARLAPPVRQAPPTAAAKPSSTPPAARPATASAAASSSAAPLCFVVGPIPSESQAQELRAALAPSASQVTVRAEAAARDVRYAVLSADKVAATAVPLLLEKIHSAGFPEAVALAGGRNAGRISVGVYSGPKLASQRHAAINAAGFDFEIVQMSKTAQTYWLDTEAPRSAAAVSRHLEAIAAARPAGKAEPTRCRAATVARN